MCKNCFLFVFFLCLHRFRPTSTCNRDTCYGSEIVGISIRTDLITATRDDFIVPHQMHLLVIHDQSKTIAIFSSLYLLCHVYKPRGRTTCTETNLTQEVKLDLGKTSRLGFHGRSHFLFIGNAEAIQFFYSDLNKLYQK